MKQRQIKKNSKSAMDLLVKLFCFKLNDFYYSDEKWILIYSSCCERNALSALNEQLYYKTSKWVELDWNGQPRGGISLYGIKLICYCRKLAKAGVTFK